MKTFFHIWLTPIILAVVSGIGLLSALTGDDIWDALSWVTLGIPIMVSVYYLTKSAKRNTTRFSK